MRFKIYDKTAEKLC